MDWGHVERIVASLVAVVALGGCKREVQCHGELSPDDLYELYKQTQRGREPCPGLLRPVVEADADHVALNRRTVAQSAAMKRHGGKIQPLYDDLKRNRELWKQLHPGEAFDAEPEVTLSPWMPAGMGAAVLQTTAFAGYPAITVRTGRDVTKIRWCVPGPPRVDEPLSPESLFVREVDDGGYLVWKQVGADESRTAEQNVKRFADLPGAVERVCQAARGSCAHALAVDVRGDVHAMMVVLETVTRVPAVRAASPCVAWHRPIR